MTQEFERKINIKEIEKKWQKRWNEARIFESDPDKREKYYINFPFPYINGAPHLGHGYSLLKAEAMARYQRMLGKNVLFPFAFHATGEPIAGIAKRVRAGDKIQIKSLIKSGIPKDEIDKFTDSMNIINFFRKQWTNTVQSLGTAIDWRRQFVTTQLTPTFSKFIEWQYNKLKEDGFVVQGSHPVVWCPADQNPTGDHDRLEGEGARVVDFIMLKFKSTKHDAYLLPATLRPETIFGVTNIFLHPKAQYIKMKINDINYIVAKDTLIKFQDQKFDVEDIMDIDIKDLIGENAINPITNQEVLILPGDFIDTAGSTGVVMSVPAHAPMDWITLQDLKNSPSQLEAWGISEEMITSIQPISLIELEGYGEFPAKEGLDSFNVTSKSDPNVKEATKQIYKKEFNSGKLRSITGKYAGMSIVEVKDQITSDLIDNNIAMKLKEPGEVVICRCGTRNHVKFLENQWFLNFSDEKWKKKTYDLIKEMDFYPPEARKAFENTIDWLEDKACARKSGLGTPLPWDNDWIVETLSDSVIYMAYYIVSKYVNSGEFKIEYATKEIFDYIMLGKGKVVELVESTGIDKKLLSNIRKDLQYFYGFDLRTSGKDLMNNHLSFMLMHHTAIFPKSFHPKAIAVNGYVAI
ncbi:MAG: leucine--tRNA ligase, partial [Candidatus Heimdallarchaeota archaeon]|nr:leucine--tRNA ligase [Candidatus Heimdallarchaeota archaeon]